MGFGADDQPQGTDEGERKKPVKGRDGDLMFGEVQEQDQGQGRNHEAEPGRLLGE